MTTFPLNSIPISIQSTGKFVIFLDYLIPGLQLSFLQAMPAYKSLLWWYWYEISV